MKRNMDTAAHKIFPDVGNFQLECLPVVPLRAELAATSQQTGKSFVVFGALHSRVGVKVLKLLLKLVTPSSTVTLALSPVEQKNPKLQCLKDYPLQVVEYLPTSAADFRRVLDGVCGAFYQIDGTTTLDELRAFLSAAESVHLPLLVSVRETVSNNSPVYENLQRCDELLLHSGVKCAHVVHDHEFDNACMRKAYPRVLLQRCLTLAIGAEDHVRWMDIADVTEVLVLILLHPEKAQKRRLEITGPESMTGVQMAAVLSGVLKEEVQFLSEFPESSPPDTLTPPEADPTDEVFKLLNRKPTSFCSWCEERYIAMAGDEVRLESALAVRGGVEELLRRVATGDKVVHTEVDKSQLRTCDQIGAGASGIVFRGLFQGMPVAIKRFGTEYSDREEFAKEAALVCVLRHPNLVLCIGAVTQTTPLCLVFELMNRGSLEAMLLETTDLLPPAMQTRLACDIARGMTFLHTVGVYHRDLKCSNLLLTASLQVRVTDFGTAIPVNKQKLIEDFQGTPPYIAPELWLENKSGLPADVFAFAIVLWSITTRRTPWADMTMFAIAEEVTNGKRLPLSPENTFQAMITACWLQDPSQRPTFVHLLQELEDAYTVFATHPVVPTVPTGPVTTVAAPDPAS
eukprot:TRINITY_DN3708_c0_g3_i10.p1 TRINITY_DN3708_c0_g3~~TRINITY_DN3708_c0_g3_i10.p1  ORF type:complete len:628 (-),score=110.12 TRINITY_DN3708_c0_g3_i10:97-1980(-)